MKKKILEKNFVENSVFRGKNEIFDAYFVLIGYKVRDDKSTDLSRLTETFKRIFY